MALAVLGSLLLMCSGLGLLFLHQASQLKGQVIQAERLVANYNTNVLPRVTAFVNNLQAFSKSNPDFLPILTKYGLQPGGASAAPAPASKK